HQRNLCGDRVVAADGGGSGMSENDKQTTATPARPPRGHGPFAGAGMPAEKSMNFGPSAMRLIRRLRPEWFGIIGVVLLAIASVVASVLGPKILGEGTNLIFEGAFSKQFPAGVTQEQLIA